MCDLCQIFGKSSTGVVEFFMHRIQCINYVCLHGPLKPVYFCTVDSNAMRRKSGVVGHFIMASYKHFVQLIASKLRNILVLTAPDIIVSL